MDATQGAYRLKLFLRRYLFVAGACHISYILVKGLFFGGYAELLSNDGTVNREL